MQYMSKFEVWINFPRSCEWPMACLYCLARVTSREGSCRSPAWMLRRNMPTQQGSNGKSAFNIFNSPIWRDYLTFLGGHIHILLSCAVTKSYTFLHTCPTTAYSNRHLSQPRNCDPDRTLQRSVWQFPAHWWSSWVWSIPSTSEKKRW